MKQFLHHRFVSLVAIILIAFSVNTYGQTAPFVKVLQPNDPGIEWVAGQSYLISWTDNLTKPVLIELANFGVAPIAYTILAPSVEGSTWVWNIPEGFTPGNQYRINIFSTVNQSIVDWSDNYFTIVAAATGSYINIEQPNLPNIKWLRGTTQVVSWMDNMPGKVKVELINDNLTAYDNALDVEYASGWSPGKNGGYGFEPWMVATTGTVDGSIGNPALIGIIGMDNPSFYLQSQNIASSIIVDRPFEPLAIGSTFSCDLAMDMVTGTLTGKKGMEIRNSKTIFDPTTKLIDIKLENNDIITINGAPMFSNYGVNVMKLKFEYFEANKLRVSGIGRDGSESFNQVFTITGVPQLARFYSLSNLDADNHRRIYFNNLKITTPDLLLADNVEGTTYYWPITTAYAFGDKYKIRVTSKVAPDIKDVSENYFAITATDGAPMEMLQPNSVSPLITWLKGSTYLVSWNGNGAFPVKVELFKGATFKETIGASVEGTTKLWTVPTTGLVNGTDYNIKVTRLADGVSVTGANFSIQSSAPGGSITVLQPTAGGIEWMRGSAHLISWNPTIPGPFNIELYSSFTGLSTMIATGVEGSTWVWNIPASTYPVGNYYKINVWSSDNVSYVGSSLNFFKLIDYPTGGTITVLQPSLANIVWVRGTSNLIAWNPTIQGPFNIELYNQSTGTNIMIATGVAGSTWVWNIPVNGSYPIGTQYKINVWSADNNTVVGSSAHFFALADTPAGGSIEVLQPNGGETLYIGQGYLIAWIDDVPEPVDIFLVNSSPASELLIADNVVGSTWVWDITPLTLPDNSYRIRIKSSLLPSIQDESNGDFTVAILPMAFSVYPNPARDVINVKFDESANETYTVQLTDRFNMLISTKVVEAAFIKEVQISTAALHNGVYFMTITSNKTKSVQKVMVQH